MPGGPRWIVLEGVGGFGTPDENRRVELAAVAFVTRRFKKDGWKVEKVSLEKRGYDLLCQRGRSKKHVEVKGCKGSQVKFIITKNEKKAWSSDSRFVLALVTNALGSKRGLQEFRSRDLEKFRFEPLAFVATLKRANH